VTVTLDDVRAAAERIAPHVHRTPVFRSRSIDEVGGAELYLKCENLQRAGSFKARGAHNAVWSLAADAAGRGVATHSSGNHAAALALAAHGRGVPATIVMPANAPAVKRAAVEAFGARVVEVEASEAARVAALEAIVAETGAVAIPPFDDDAVIAGQGTVALELLADVPDLDAVVAPVGGGGLISGIGIAAHGLRADLRLVGAEPALADDAARSLASGELLPSGYPDTIADGLRTSLSPRTFGHLQHHVERIVTVTEDEIVAAMRLLWTRAKLVVEPSGAVSLAAVIAARRQETSLGARIGVVVSGGNVDVDALPF
jgi:threonine dehydratase